MENWIVMAAATLIVCALFPPLLGFLIGAGGIMLATCVVYAIICGLSS